MEKKLSVNRYIKIIVFMLFIFATMQFIYLYLRSLSIAPNYTGTVSDIVIATTNIILATCAILAFKNISSLFKDKLSDTAISKIDTALMSLDECIDNFSSLYLSMMIAKVYKRANDPKNPQLVAQLDKASDNLKDATALAYKAKHIISSLTRWNVSPNTEYGIRLNQLLDDTFELGMQATSMYLALINEITPNSPTHSLTDKTFEELFDKFNEERLRLDEENKELKEIPIHEVFRVK
ncbi:hypothetical protein ACHS69_004131 [Escherichia coli]|uniref:hypothetical protein n=1 Tax=Escherichia coli TaxID=562 RepID=UPI001F4992E0|nr:hypothetical protein [Escherichia coli]